eukprot:3646058-Rhodomonas_salina.2
MPYWLCPMLCCAPAHVSQVPCSTECGHPVLSVGMGYQTVSFDRDGFYAAAWIGTNGEGTTVPDRTRLLRHTVMPRIICAVSYGGVRCVGQRWRIGREIRRRIRVLTAVCTRNARILLFEFAP